MAEPQSPSIADRMAAFLPTKSHKEKAEPNAVAKAKALHEKKIQKSVNFTKTSASRLGGTNGNVSKGVADRQRAFLVGAQGPKSAKADMGVKEKLAKNERAQENAGGGASPGKMHRQPSPGALDSKFLEKTSPAMPNGKAGPDDPISPTNKARGFWERNVAKEQTPTHPKGGKPSEQEQALQSAVQKPEGIIKEGMLKKQGKLPFSWPNFWVVLVKPTGAEAGGELRYFGDSTYVTPKGSHVISGAHVEVDQANIVITITLGQAVATQTINFRAASAEEAQEWFAELSPVSDQPNLEGPSVDARKDDLKKAVHKPAGEKAKRESTSAEVGINERINRWGEGFANAFEKLGANWGRVSIPDKPQIISSGQGDVTDSTRAGETPSAPAPAPTRSPATNRKSMMHRASLFFFGAPKEEADEAEAEPTDRGTGGASAGGGVEPTESDEARDPSVWERMTGAMGIASVTPEPSRDAKAADAEGGDEDEGKKKSPRRSSLLEQVQSALGMDTAATPEPAAAPPAEPAPEDEVKAASPRRGSVLEQISDALGMSPSKAKEEPRTEKEEPEDAKNGAAQGDDEKKVNMRLSESGTVRVSLSGFFK